MNTSYNQLELSSIYNQLKSKNYHQQEIAAKSLALFIHKNRNGGDDLLKKIATLLHPNSGEISDSVLFKVINNVLKILKDNSTLIINFLNMIFPLLFHIIFYLSRSIDEFDQTTKMIGQLIVIGGSHLSQVVENNVNSLFDRFNNPSFKYEYTKYASLSLLKEFTKSAPVIVYNKIVDKFDDFLKIIDNYKDSKECIRVATAGALEEFILLLNNREPRIKEYYCSQIYYRIDKNFETKDANYIHGILNIIKTFAYNKEYFNENHNKFFNNYILKNKNNSSQDVRLCIIEMIPLIASTLQENFNDIYLSNVVDYLLLTIKNKQRNDVKVATYNTIGKLSVIIENERFTCHALKIIKQFKSDLDSKHSICTQLFSCLAKLMINFSDIIISNINYEDILTIMFSKGFFESQCLFLEKLINYYDSKSKPQMNIIMAVLNVIAIIISEKKFHSIEANTVINNYEYEIFQSNIINTNNNEICNSKLNIKDKANDNLTNKEDNQDFINTSMYNTNTCIINKNNTIAYNMLPTTENSLCVKKVNKKERHSSIGNKPLINKDFINNSRKGIKDYIISILSNNKIDSYNLASIMIQNALQFLKIIKHEFFLKDILTFYQEHCLKYLIDPVQAKKETVISLANACWVPDFRETQLDFNQEYKLNIIVDAYLNVLLNDASDEVKIKLLNSIDERYYKLLASNSFFEKIVLVLNFDDTNLKEKIVELIGNLLNYNYATIIVFIKKTILEIFNSILLSIEKFDCEEAVVVLSYFVKYSGKYILDYVQLIFPQLIEILKFSVYEENDILNKSILCVVSELIVHNKKFNSKIKFEQLTKIIEVCVENLKDNSNLNKQEISLKTVLSILENSSYKFKIYYNHPLLVNSLIELLVKDSPKVSRNLALRIFGFIGAMDNENLEKIWSIHKIKTNFLNENYEVDEYNIIEDTELLDHQRKKVKNEMIAMKMIENSNKTAVNNNKKSYKQDKVDFDKLISDQEIDPCTYYAVKALVNILNEENMETGVHVIQFLGNLIKSLQDSEHPVVDLLLKTLINIIVDYDSNLVKAIFDIFMIILRNFKNVFKNHLKEILKTIEFFIDKNEFQNVVFNLLIKIFENFGNDMKEFFPHWIPKLVSLLFENLNPLNKDRNSYVSKYIFQCFAINAPYLGNYLSLIINDVIKLLSLPSDFNLSGSFNSKTANSTKVNTNSLQTKPSIYLYPILYKEVNESIMPNYNNIMNEDFSQEDILTFLESVLGLTALTQYLPKIVMGLLKFIETHSMNVTLVDKVIRLFVKMAVVLKKKFIVFLPSIIRSTKHMNIPLNVFFNKIKVHIEKDNYNSTILKVRSNSENENEINDQKSTLNCVAYSMYNYENKSPVNEKYKTDNYFYDKFDRENMTKNRKNQMEREVLVKEFDPSNCSLEEDWREWFISSVKALFWQSPNYPIYYCYNVLDYYLPLHTELYNYAFISCWRNLNDYQKCEITNSLKIALKAPKIPKDILLIILNLSEYIEREEQDEFISISLLGDVASNCKAYAKALYYKESYFRSNTNTSSNFEKAEDLISLYYHLKLPEAAYGLLKLTKQYGQNKQINDDDWIIKLRKWNTALDIFNKKLEEDAFNPEYLRGKMMCLEGLCNWEELINLSDDIETKIENDTNNLTINNNKNIDSNNINIINNYFDNENNNYKSSPEKATDNLNIIKSNSSGTKSNNALDTNNNKNKESDNIYENVINNMIPTLARASMNLGEWNRVGHYIKKIPDDSQDEDLLFEKNFFLAIIKIKEEDYNQAKKFIETSRNIIDDKIKTLLSESYERAYSVLLENQHLYELEELIQYKMSNGEMEKSKLYENWDMRLENISEEVKVYERVLAIRSLVFDVNEDYDIYLEMAKICIREDRFSSCMNILDRFNSKIDESNKDIKLRVNLQINKCLYESNKKELAISNLEKIINSDLDSIIPNVKSKLYSTCGTWKYNELEKKNSLIEQEKTVKDTLSILQRSYMLDSTNYRAWHSYGLLNYKYFEELFILLDDNKYVNKNYINTTLPGITDISVLKDTYKSKIDSECIIEYAKNAINGFINSVRVGGSNISRTLQDLLRIIELSFMLEYREEIAKLIEEAIQTIEVETWILVIPQLLARIHNLDSKLNNLLSLLFKKIGYSHPRALIYPLTVMTSSKNKKRRKVAYQFLYHISNKNKTLTNECNLIINELNRCALLLHEEWNEAIEESANLLFKRNDIEGMINTLMSVHDKMNTPETLNEIHFYQVYGNDLNEAKYYLKQYMETENIMDLKQSWDTYHSIYKSIDENFLKINYLDLENISPKLYHFTESEICIAGMYKPGYPVVKIRGFENSLTVIKSKQQPRKLVIYGSEGKEYNFLLKGHEDLRQDESAMQLFSLVNTLLADDTDTESKNMFIKRFPIVPLSLNTGLIGWVDNCDTLHQLIIECRICPVNSKIKDAEKRLINSMCPKFEYAAFLNKLEVFKLVQSRTRGLEIYQALWRKSKNSEIWLDRRTNYSRSLAVMSIVGYILGLGDRHPSNLMLDRISGKVIHIDFGDCFEVAMKRDKFPEKVPFRLTRMLVKALEVGCIEGTFRLSCENVMRVLRANKHSLIAILAAFLHNPLISFRLQLPNLIKAQKNKNSLVISTKDKDASNSLKKDKINNYVEDNKINNNIKGINVQVNVHDDEKERISKAFKLEKLDNNEYVDDLRKTRMESNERQLFNRFEERDEIEFEELNKIAKMVLSRIIDKLQGTDFDNDIPLDVDDQVDKLIKQATNSENLCQNYIGWCPFW